jgi:hypothetical protein
VETTNKVILWRLNLTIVAMEKQQCFLFIVIGTDVAVNIEEFSVAMEIQQWVRYVLLFTYKTFCTAFNNNY